jgi:hypothetical protein
MRTRTPPTAAVEAKELDIKHNPLTSTVNPPTTTLSDIHSEISEDSILNRLKTNLDKINTKFQMDNRKHESQKADQPYVLPLLKRTTWTNTKFQLDNRKHESQKANQPYRLPLLKRTTWTNTKFQLDNRKQENQKANQPYRLPLLKRTTWTSKTTASSQPLILLFPTFTYCANRGNTDRKQDSQNQTNRLPLLKRKT